MKRMPFEKGESLVADCFSGIFEMVEDEGCLRIEVEREELVFHACRRVEPFVCQRKSTIGSRDHHIDENYRS